MSTSVIPGAALSRITSTAATNLPIAVTATPTYTVTTANSTVIFNGATATTIGAWTLPDPTTSRDKELKLSSNLGIVNFTVTGGTSIQSNGAALTSLRSGQGIELKSDGTTWYETTQDVPMTARSASIQNLTTAGLVQLAAGTNSAASIATAAEIRSAAGLGTIATQNFNAVNITGGVVRDISLSALVSNSVFESLASHVDRSTFYDRFADADRRYAVTYTGASSNPEALWDPSTDTFCTIDPGNTLIIEIDFANVKPWTVNTTTGFTYNDGIFYVNQYDVNAAASITWEFYRRVGTTDAWEQAAQLTSFGNRSINSVAIAGTNWIKKCRITIVAGAVCRIAGLRYVATRPDTEDQPTVLFNSGGASQKCHTPIDVQNAGGTSRLTLGQGTIRINTGATLNWQSGLITPTLNGAATQTLTVAVPGSTGIFVRSTNAQITGECTGTGANNVILRNPAALTGSVSILLERYV